MTVNTRRDAAHDRALLRTDDELLVNFAVTNTGAAESGKFYISLYVDDTLKETFKVENLSFNNIAAFQNFSLGTLSAGTHEIRAVIDSDDNVVEEYDANNIYRKTVVVTEAAAQLQVSSAGGFVVSSGDSAANFALLSRARVHLRGDDATATDAVVSSGGTLFVSSGGMLIDSLIDSAGKLYVYSHGLTSQVTLIAIRRPSPAGLVWMTSFPTAALRMCSAADWCRVRSSPPAGGSGWRGVSPRMS